MINKYERFQIPQHCMTTYKPTAITTDRKDAGSSVQCESGSPKCSIPGSLKNKDIFNAKCSKSKHKIPIFSNITSFLPLFILN